MSNNPSICIPRCESPHQKNLYYIFSKFGHIKNIQIYNKKVIINYKYWFMNDATTYNIINRLNTEKCVNIVYEFPWFWRCFKNA